MTPDEYKEVVKTTVDKTGYAFLDLLRRIKESSGNYDPSCSEVFFDHVTHSMVDRRYSGLDNDEEKKTFHENLQRFVNATDDSEKKLTAFWEHGKETTVKWLINNPKKAHELFDLFTHVPGFNDLFQEGGLLHKDAKLVVNVVLGKDDITEESRRITDIFGQLEKDDANKLKDLWDVGSDIIIAKILAEPDVATELFALSQVVPKLFPLLEEGGSLHTNARIVLEKILAGDEAITQKAREIVSYFTTKVPYWKQLYFYTEARLGDALADASSRYPIDTVPEIKRYRDGSFDFSEEFLFIEKSVRDMSIVEKRRFADYDELDDASVAALDTIPFYRFHGKYKKLIFAHLLEKTVETSRSGERRALADQRNRNAPDKIVLQKGMYIHGSPIDVMDSVILNGNLPNEALGEESRIDSYPFHTDFTRIEQDLLEGNNTVREALENSITGKIGYGTNSSLGKDAYIRSGSATLMRYMNRL